jgi:hypothetical protein
MQTMQTINLINFQQILIQLMQIDMDVHIDHQKQLKQKQLQQKQLQQQKLLRHQKLSSNMLVHVKQHHKHGQLFNLQQMPRLSR